MTDTGTWSVGPYRLRPHQVRAVRQLRQALWRLKQAQEPQRVILQGVCSFGKTIVSSYMVQQAASKGARIGFIAHGRVLIFQKSDTLSDCEIPHAVLMADSHKHLDAAYAVPYGGDGSGSPVVVVSKDSYQSRLARGDLQPLDVDVWIVDEAHTALSPDWIAVLNKTSSAAVVGLTATPALGDGRGLGSYYRGLVVAASHEELLAGGYLVPCRYFSPWSVDTVGLSVNPSTGEYVQPQVADRFGSSDLVGDFVSEWHRVHRTLGESYRTTAFYASSVAHSATMAKQFREGDGTLLCPGVPWEHVDADTPQAERRRIYQALAKGDVQGVSNYAVLRVGFDCPAISLLQIGVAMHSTVQYLQTVGRGFRTHPGKSDCIILDHGGNLQRHGWPQADRPWSLDERTTLKERELKAPPQPKEKTCVRCGAVYRASQSQCPECGHQKARRGEFVKPLPGLLEEVRAPAPVKRKAVCEAQKLWNRLYFASRNSKRPRSSSFLQLRARFHSKHRRYYVDTSGPLTRVRDRKTNHTHVLGNVPRPRSPLWDWEVRNVERQDLQFAERITDGGLSAG